MLGGILSIFAGIVGLAGLGLFLGSNNTSSIINSIFSGFTGSLSAAVGAS
jgi:hypothetical protein